MSNKNIYDPEDLEQLLKNKSFSQLLPEEKAFVLQYVDNDLEYEGMRNLYAELGVLPEFEEQLVPKPETKHNIMAAFEDSAVVNESKKKTPWWLWFWNSDQPLYQRPVFQLATGCVVLFLGVQFFTNPEQKSLAEHQNVKVVEKEDSNETRENSSTQAEIKSKQPNDATKPLSNLTNQNIAKTSGIGNEDQVDNILEETKEIKDDRYFSDNSGGSIVDKKQDNDLILDFKSEDQKISSETTEEANATEEMQKEDSINKLFEKDAVADSNFYDLVEGYSFSDDYTRTHLGNATTTLSDVSMANTALDSPVAQFGLDEEEETPAITLNSFNQLLGKLYTAE